MGSRPGPGLVALVLPALLATACSGAAGDDRSSAPLAVPAGPSTPWRTGAAQAMSRVHAVPLVDATCRQVLRTTVGGDQVRVRLSNAAAPTPLVLRAATVAVRASGGSLRPGTVRPLVLPGAAGPGLTLAASATVTTEPVDLPVQPGDDVVVSLAFAGSARPAEHALAAAAASCSAPGSGDLTAQESSSGFLSTGRDGLVVDGLEVRAPDRAPAGVLVVGDSLTDPALLPDRYQRWSDEVSRRLGPQVAVANAGIGGNRVLAPGGYGPTLVQRFDRDVLQRPGVGTLVLLEGTNDVSSGVAAREITARLEELCGRARAAGVRVVLLTLPPAYRRPPEQEPVRLAVNAWVRTTRSADAVVDAEAVLRDPGQPTHLLPAYDVGDGLHLSAAGHQALGDAVARVLLDSGQQGGRAAGR